MSKTKLDLGVIAGPHGLEGALRFKPFVHKSDTLQFVKEVTLQSPDDQSKVYRVFDLKPFKKHQLLILEGVDDLKTAESLKGALVSVEIEKARQAKCLTDDEFFFEELVGLEVLDQEGEHLGQVTRVFSPDEAAPCLCVIEKNGQEWFMPFHEAFVKEVKRAEAKLWVHLPEDFIQN